MKKGLLIGAALTRRASSILMALAAFGLVIVTVIIGWQVFGRYVLHSSPSWSEQASLTLMIWYVCFAAAAGVKEGFHIRIVALENAVPAKVSVIMRVLSQITVAICGLALLVYGAELTARTWQHVIPSLGIPRGFAYLALPISGLLILLFSLENIAHEINGKNTTQKENF